MSKYTVRKMGQVLASSRSLDANTLGFVTCLSDWFVPWYLDSFIVFCVLFCFDVNMFCVVCCVWVAIYVSMSVRRSIQI